MTDIIANARQLLEGATPGPWVISGEFDPEYPELQGAPQLENGLLKVPIISHNIYGDFFPEDGDLIAKSWANAKALAEETWEYGVEYKYLTNRGAEWRLDPGVGWHKTYRDAERAASASVQYRIVRRRVSLPEVINE